ncbi:hypothetical protein PLICRDRAFT_161408 [Plicaturopsis crispa FD-325 SS-3]|nr:hypothetical protein PLICRDRAFT_161408 [Plicaturopsis crispa FD-325 SS-3]
MSLPPDPNGIVLHVWPRQNWNLPSLDAPSVAAVLYLQLAIPHLFTVEECIDPTLSPSGQLPFLTHEHRAVASFPSIVKYVSTLDVEGTDVDLDAPLGAAERAQRTAWAAHIESNLGDLVAHTFYSLPENWVQLTQPALAGALPLPQKYYVPDRIRDSHRVRLNAAGLWNQPGIEVKAEERKPPFAEQKKDDPDVKDVFKRVFEREKILTKGRSYLDKYARLLGDKLYFLHERPTTLDIVLAAHILALTRPPFPDPLLKSLVVESYPSLVAHAERVYSSANQAPLKTRPPPTPSIFPWLSARRSGPKVEKIAEDVQSDGTRWGWIALVVAAMGAFIITSGVEVSSVAQEETATDENEA